MSLNSTSGKVYTNIWYEASAPSNIALIKYMGKTDTAGNKPTNSSLSYTLNNLRTFVRIKQNGFLTEDRWSPYVRDDLRPIELSEKGRQKFLDFFTKLKVEFKLEGCFEIESANNFPSDCGLASSASSFAALTLVAHQFSGSKYLPRELARISQKGSGSSCRSFFSPWSLWHEQGAEEIQFPLKDLKHLVILCDENKKTVSSSQAHVRVLTSDLFKGRPERAQERLQKLIQLLRAYNSQKIDLQNWKSMFELCWNEFWDMHTLFHTSSPAFMYLNGEGFAALASILETWHVDSDGPIVTMDAGSNIHLLFRPNQAEHYLKYIHMFNDKFNIWSDEGYLNRGSLK
ncbi:MAG: diphosphomevalonate/mevalonate 3,5-bisphosphate decarboxylase family protein [Pseudobdellovibrio sp.]